MPVRFAALAFVVYLGSMATDLVATPFDLPAECRPGTLASYITLGEEGCAIGFMRYNNFGFDVLSAIGVEPGSAEDIFLTPATATRLGTLGFESPLFSVTGEESVSYLVRYLIDPHPEIFGFDIEMSSDTPVAPGEAIINTALCIGGDFTASLSCRGFLETLEVFHRGSAGAKLNASSEALGIENKVAVLDVRHEIILRANGASSEFDGFTTRTHRDPDGSGGAIPEPGTWMLMLGGVAAIVFGRRRFAG